MSLAPVSTRLCEAQPAPLFPPPPPLHACPRLPRSGFVQREKMGMSGHLGTGSDIE